MAGCLPGDSGSAERFKLFARASLSFCQVFSSGRFGWSMVPAEISLFDFLANVEAPFTVSTALGASARNVPPILIMLAWLVAWRTGRLRVAPLGIGLLLITALATFLTPSEAFGGSNVELRMGAIFIVVGLSVLAVEWTRLIPWPRPSLICSFYFALLAAGSALTIVSWRAPVAAVAELRQMNATHLPYGARLATALADSDRDDLWHVADFAILDRKAFVPAFFATPGQSTVRLKQPFAAIGAVNADDGGAITVSEVKTLLSGDYDGLDDDDALSAAPLPDPCLRLRLSRDHWIAPARSAC